MTSLEKQALFEKLCHKNSIRRQLGIRPIDIPTVYHRKLRLTAIARSSCNNRGQIGGSGDSSCFDNDRAEELKPPDVEETRASDE